jgi:hypothetical protein
MNTEVLNAEGETVAEAVNKRKLASIRIIDAIDPIEGADAIEVATVGGWKIVVKKGELKAGDLAIYCEIDSWIPTEIAEFLSKGKEPRVYEGVRGEKLRTIRLRGQLSQGLLLPLSVLSHLVDVTGAPFVPELGADVSDELNIQKWEAQLPSCLQGQALGLFPSFIRKTDQERCLSGDTLISTDGGTVSIKTLCAMEVKPKVWSFNHLDKAYELKPVVGQSIMPVGGVWIKITTKSGKSIVMTDNHRVWCEDEQAYKASSNLKVGQRILTKN